MPFDLQFALLAAIVALGFTTEAATGFGSIVIALTLAAHLYPIHELIPLLVVLNIVLSSYMVCRHHHHIERRLLLVQVLPLMAVGMAGGLVVFNSASSDTLKLAFGVFVVAVSLRELGVLLANRGARVPLGASASAVGIVGAGVIHGIFATGGPLLVYIIGRSELGKRNFRSTLASVWLVLNSTLAVVFTISGRINGGLLPAIAALVPVVVASIVVGEWTHQRLSERGFRIAVFTLLLLAGTSLVV